MLDVLTTVAIIYVVIKFLFGNEDGTGWKEAPNTTDRKKRTSGISNRSSDPSRNPHHKQINLDELKDSTLRKAAVELGIHPYKRKTAARDSLVKLVRDKINEGEVSDTLLQCVNDTPDEAASSKDGGRQLSTGNESRLRTKLLRKGWSFLEDIAHELNLDPNPYGDRAQLVGQILKKENAEAAFEKTMAAWRTYPQSVGVRKSKQAHAPKSKVANPDNIKLDSFILTDTGESSVRRLVKNVNERLVRMRKRTSQSRYARSAAIELVGETIVAWEMSTELRSDGDDYNSQWKSLWEWQAKKKVADVRERLYKENAEVFERYFENEPGVVDLDLTLLRQACTSSSTGDPDATFQVEYMYAYYHGILGMYYGWQVHRLTGDTIEDAVEKVTGIASPTLYPASLHALTAHFGPVLVDPESTMAGKLPPVYTPPVH